MEKSYLSFSAPPLPYFVEGNSTTFHKGQQHPARRNLGFFDIILVREGTLCIGEEALKWNIAAGEALILEPNKYHYSTARCASDTTFYWLHMQSPSYWMEQSACTNISSTEAITSLHYHTEQTTIHLPKYQHIPHRHVLYDTVENLLQSTTQPRSFAFWETQQLFMQVLQHLSYNPMPQHTSLRLAEHVEMYIKQHYNEHITNATLAKHFHVHENYLVRCMKQAFACTPLAYLAAYRLHQSRLLLLTTDWSLQQIAEEVGFTRQGYFSKSFKAKYGLSPSQYRQDMSKA
ncbi:AraC family transcriptional regulator [Terribacillus saccharophilus]|uniref:helix-turn-helix transcriptional regulator n=1 Tax=Terribacillus saccharophilus TaxID=361277 RepID=UPI000BA7DA6E|nr:helix-turn-helix domain-containing protein [Terribacillus saccharophilus]PAF36846.1 AraC family transcriptional regulator [Terribacillus saccharophilus]